MLRQGSSVVVLSKHGLHLHNPFVETTHIGIAKPWTRCDLSFPSYELDMNYPSTTKFCRLFSEPSSPSQILEISSSFAHKYLFLHYGNIIEQQDKQISHLQQCNLM